MVGCLPRKASRMSQNLVSVAQNGPGTCDRRYHDAIEYATYMQIKLYSDTVNEIMTRGNLLVKVMSCCSSRLVV